MNQISDHVHNAGGGWRGRLQVLCAAALCAVSAELLAAYSATTGDIGAIAFALILFMGLYGAPALLARELARKAGWGWPSMILLFMALGIAQPAIIDQALFAEQYSGYEGWEETRQATFIPFLGISAYNAYIFVIGHVIFSFGAPIAIAEAWQPRRATKPWLGWPGLIIASLAYLGASLLIIFDPESGHASTTQRVVSSALVAGCIVLAWYVGQRQKRTRSREMKVRPHPFAILLATFMLATLGMFFEDDWLGLAIGVLTTVLIGTLMWLGAKHTWWDAKHTAAVGLGFLFSRGLLAFLYFPLAGDVGALAKYAHNVVMLLVVVAAAYFALRPRHAQAPGIKAPPSATALR